MKRFLGCLVFILSGCAGWFTSLVPGTSREDDVFAKFGAPDAVRQLPDGSRVLEYPREPEGMENWRVTLAPDGTLSAVQQLVSEPTFAKITRGMSRERVLNELGRPSEEKSFALLNENVVSWRYQEFGRRIMFFNAHFNPSGQLKYVSRSPDPSAANDGARR